MPNWTPDQLSAINERDRTLLVSAAAGSGKTAVLSERIISALSDTEHPASISRMLIVTFTRAAAGEMQHRIAKKLAERLESDLSNKHLARQLMSLGGASISTIDSFYLDVVRENFEKTSLPPTFRLVDESELINLRRDVMNETVDKMYREVEGFSELGDLFSDLRSETALTESLISVYKSLLNYPDGIDFLLTSAEKIEKSLDSILASEAGVVWANEVRELASYGKAITNTLTAALDEEENCVKLTQKYFPIIESYRIPCEAALRALEDGDYTAAREALTRPTERDLRGAPSRSEEFATLLRVFVAFADTWDKLCPALAAFSAEEIRESATRSSQMLTLLHKTLSHFDREYRAAKALREVAEFKDISRAAYDLLIDQTGEPTPLAREIADKYDAVYIDEYQDVDAMQDATFRAVSKPRGRFMVGDIKQSIYRFRGAQPSVFAGYRHTLRPLSEAGDDDAATVFMSNCFRCDEPIIRFTNAVSGSLFETVADSIGYEKKDDLVFSKTENAGCEKCRVVLVQSAKTGLDGVSKPLAHEEEARYIASEILRLTGGETLASGKPITFGDIAILVHSRSICPTLAEIFSAYGIPFNDNSRERFFENPDVLCVYSLLASLDNPLNDVYLAATLRSPFFGFTLEDLLRLRRGADRSLSLYETIKGAEESTLDEALCAKLSQFKARFEVFREKAVSLPVDRLLRYLYRETAILSLAGHAESDRAEATARRANLQRLYEYARTFESGGFKGLYQFVRYVENVMENNVEMPPLEGDKNAVSIVTIHSSKGLEYPVCFLANAGALMSAKDAQPHFLHDLRLGCALRLPNAGAFSRANTFHREVIARSLAEQSREEEMRVLYVALTRARERLYVTAKHSKALMERATLAAASPIPDFHTKFATSFAQWILSALYRDGDYVDYATIDEVKAEELPLPQKKEKSVEETTDNGAEIRRVLLERFAFSYPDDHLARLPAKLSVSRLSPGVLDVYDTDGVAPDEVREADVERLLHTFSRVPLFGSDDEEILAAARGTATHEFLQFCRFEQAKTEGVAAELSYLVENAFISPDSKDLVRVDELTAFFKSDFYASLSRAKEIHRETRFHIFLPAALFTKDEAFAKRLAGENLAVQGVIDLFYYDENGRLILCDYKTDRLSPRELENKALAAKKLGDRHREQLSYYARALTEICGRAPDKILIYSLPLGEALEIS